MRDTAWGKLPWAGGWRQGCRYLKEVLGLSEAQRREWHRHWLGEGFQSLEVMLNDPATGRLCHGNHATMADLFFIPQVSIKPVGLLALRHLDVGLMVSILTCASPGDMIRCPECDPHARDMLM